MRTVLVTGATDGIGLATAKKLFHLGHKVLVHGRSEEKARFATGQVITATTNPECSSKDAIPVWGDLSNMSEVVQLAHQVRKAAPELDVLLNNAGVYMNERVLTNDGFEMTFAVNHLAPFLLTHHLLPELKKRNHARVITVSSIAHSKGHLNLDNLQSEKHFDPYEAYAMSKLCNVLFTRALAALTKNTPVTANCLHPGVIATKLLHAGFNIQGEKTSDGAKTSVFLVTAPEAATTTGAYFVNSRETIASRLAQDDKLAVQLWKKSEELLKNWL